LSKSFKGVEKEEEERFRKSLTGGQGPRRSSILSLEFNENGVSDRKGICVHEQRASPGKALGGSELAGVIEEAAFSQFVMGRVDRTSGASP
jgi:hypothetical protein